MKFTTRPILISICLTIILFLFYADWSYDDPYITYRYAYNIIQGDGFVYNLGERVLSTTSPLFAVLIAFFGSIYSNLPKVAILMGCVSLGLSGYLLLLLGNEWKATVAGWAGLVLLPTFTMVSNTISSETPLYIASGLACLLFYWRRQYTLTAVFSCVLIYLRPDGLLLPVILAFHFLVKRREKVPHKAILIFILLNLIGWGAIWLYFGSPIPATLLAKQQQGVMAISQKFLPGFITTISVYKNSLIYYIEAGLASIGLFYLLRRKHPGLLLVLWAVVYFISYSLLGVTRYFWYYAPLVPGFIFTVGSGLQAIYEFAKNRTHITINPKIYTGLLTFLILGLFMNQVIAVHKSGNNVDRRIRIYREVGIWLSENTPNQSKVGTLEIGVIGYYADRYMVDFAGLLQPSVAKQMKVDTNYEDTAIWAFNNINPDYIVLYANSFPNLKGILTAKCSEEAIFPADKYNAPNSMLIFNCEED